MVEYIVTNRRQAGCLGQIYRLDSVSIVEHVVVQRRNFRTNGHVLCIAEYQLSIEGRGVGDIAA